MVIVKGMRRVISLLVAKSCASGIYKTYPSISEICLPPTVFICSSCRLDDATEPQGDALATALKTLFANADDPAIRAFNIETFECMSACANPTAISFRAHNKAAYLFSGIDPAHDHDDILAFAKLYLDAKDGWIEDARPCGRLRHCLMGRIPAPANITEPE